MSNTNEVLFNKTLQILKGVLSFIKNQELTVAQIDTLLGLIGEIDTELNNKKNQL